VEYVPGACVEISVVGKSNPWVASGYINFAKCLEHALYEDGDGRWESFDSLFRAFEAEVARAVELNWRTISRNERAMAELSPFPFLSTVVADCVARGRDITDGGARYNPTQPEGVGLANVADGLAAIRRLVFEERSLSRDELLDALRRNFEGDESLRRRLLAQPKWGNDEDYVDTIGAAIAETFYGEVARYHNSRNGPYQPGFLCWVQHEPLGRACGATPDGRFAHTVLADSIGAAQGRDTHGPTAAIRSVTKFDHTPALGGMVLNLKFSPALFDDDNLPKLVALLRTYFDTGGFQAQVNVIDRDTLLEAQRHPERYENLIVRVAGWSAYFTTLSRELQDEIIARTEHGLARGGGVGLA
jgi:formate C-acetyltransferase